MAAFPTSSVAVSLCACAAAAEVLFAFNMHDNPELSTGWMTVGLLLAAILNVLLILSLLNIVPLLDWVFPIVFGADVILVIALTALALVISAWSVPVALGLVLATCFIAIKAVAVWKSFGMGLRP